MRRQICQLLAAAVVLVGLGVPVVAQSASEVSERIETLLGNAAAFEAAFEALQFAVEAEDRQTVAALVKYPFHTTLRGRRVSVRNDLEFVAHYDALVPDAVEAAILAQSYETLFVNADGVMFGSGQLWMTPVCAGRRCAQTVWLISAINR
jgi:hypothetical protein